MSLKKEKEKMLKHATETETTIYLHHELCDETIKIEGHFISMIALIYKALKNISNQSNIDFEDIIKLLEHLEAENED